MKKFIVKETRPATAIWTYEVEAVSESEALAKVFDESDVKKVDLAYDVDFGADMGVEVEGEETPTSECECTPECDYKTYTFTEAQLAEFTQMLMDQALNAAKESIRDSGVDMEYGVSKRHTYGIWKTGKFTNGNFYGGVVYNIDITGSNWMGGILEDIQIIGFNEINKKITKDHFYEKNIPGAVFYSSCFVCR